MSKRLPILAVVGATVLVIAAMIWSPLAPSSPRVRLANGFVVRVELAQNDAQRAQGLSGRASLASDEGLLFLHPVRESVYYWMKGMLIPIDIIWIDGNRVVGMSENLSTQEPPYTLYGSQVPVDKVLEVQAGFVQAHGVKIGDVLDIQLPTKYTSGVIL